MPSETANVARAKCRPFLEKLENDTFAASKNSEKKNLDVDNDVFYQHAKFQLKTPCISGHTKMTKSEKIWRFQSLHCSLLQISTFVIFAVPRI